MDKDLQRSKELSKKSSNPVPLGATEQYIWTQSGIIRGGSVESTGRLQWDGDHWKAGKEGQLSNLAYGPAVAVADDGSQVGIGANLSVTGFIQPSAGNETGNGIVFPSDPGEGSGDKAWIRYYPRTGQSCTLEIGIANNNDDHIFLKPSGNVGIGTNAPQAKLQVTGDLALTSIGPHRGQVANDSLINTIRIGSNEDKSYGAGIRAVQLAGGWSDQVRLDLCTCEASNMEIMSRLTIMPFSGNVGIGTTAPQAKLDVNGDIRSNSKPVIVGEEKLRIIRGTVNGDGTIAAGQGFTVTHVPDTGLYDVTFAEPFSADPTVAGTQVFNGDISYTGGDTRDNAVVVGVTPSKFRIKVGNALGVGADRIFGFVVVGPV